MGEILKALAELLPKIQTEMQYFGFLLFVVAVIIYALQSTKDVMVIAYGGFVGLCIYVVSHAVTLIREVSPENKPLLAMFLFGLPLVLSAALIYYLIRKIFPAKTLPGDTGNTPTGTSRPSIILEETVRDSTGRIGLLWGFFEAAARGNETDGSKVIEEAPQLAQKIEAIDDKDLRLWYRILKYYTAGVGYSMAAAVHSQKPLERTRFAQKAVPLLQKALDTIAIAQNNPSNRQAAYAAEKADRQALVPKAKIFIVLCTAIMAEFAGAAEKKYLEKQLADQIEELKTQHPAYLKKWPPQENTFLAPYFS